MWLADLPVRRLRNEWRRQFRSEPPERLSRDLLLRATAYTVADRIRALLVHASAVFDTVRSTNSTTEQHGESVAQAAALAGSWSVLPSDRQRRVVSTLATRIEFGDKSIALHIVPAWPVSAMTRPSRSYDAGAGPLVSGAAGRAK